MQFLLHRLSATESLRFTDGIGCNFMFFFPVVTLWNKTKYQMHSPDIFIVLLEKRKKFRTFPSRVQLQLLLFILNAFFMRFDAETFRKMQLFLFYTSLIERLECIWYDSLFSPGYEAGLFVQRLCTRFFFVSLHMWMQLIGSGEGKQ